MESKTKKRLKSLIGWILYVGFLIGLVYGIPRGLSYTLKTDYPMASITSGSMWPVLKKGDLIFIEGVNDAKNQVKESEIIVYQNPKGFTIHRIQELREDTLVTKGDANNVADNPISYDDVIGKLVIFNGKPLRIPLLGMVSVYLNKNKM